MTPAFLLEGLSVFSLVDTEIVWNSSIVLLLKLMVGHGKLFIYRQKQQVQKILCKNNLYICQKLARLKTWSSRSEMQKPLSVRLLLVAALPHNFYFLIIFHPEVNSIVNLRNKIETSEELIL